MARVSKTFHVFRHLCILRDVGSPLLNRTIGAGAFLIDGAFESFRPIFYPLSIVILP